MLSQALGLAALAALTPTALLAVTVFLGMPNPHRTVLLYLGGSILITAVIATMVYVALRTGHVYKPRQHPTRYGLRLGLGVVMLAGAVYLRRRWNRAGEVKESGKKGPGLFARMMATPGPRQAFIVGVLVYSPSVTFIAAVQVVATAKVSTAVAVGALALVIAVTLAFVWLPFVLYMLAPQRTAQLLTALNSWLHAHGRALGLAALVAGGVALTLNGILGLTGVVG